MRVRLRAIILLSVLYLSLVGFLYRYLWRARALDSLFDGPGNQVPQTAQDLPEFNLHRVNPPHLSQVLMEHDGAGAAAGEENISDSAQLHSKVVSNHSSSPAQNSGPLTTGRTGRTSITPHDAGGENRRPVDVSRPLSNYSVNPCLHAFYYAWYGNVETDGRYFHWNHRYLPHWQADVAKRYPQGRHVPPDDIGASFFPKLGCYSSRDQHLMESHMMQLVEAGVGVISVSWYPGGLADEEGFPPDPLLPELLDTALKHGIKVTIHIEPYKGRTPLTVVEDLKYIHKQYFSHPAFYRFRKSGNTKLMPLIYVYDSYLSLAGEWGKVLLKDGVSTIREKEHDCVVIGLLVEAAHRNFILEGGFDGFYTYFASNIFTYGSKTTNWPQLSSFAKQHDLLFIPSFGPGYEDLRVRPWNEKNTRGRQSGNYYRTMSGSALKHNHGGVVSITSFNEWHEGTQIEPAVPKQTDGYSYLDYAPEAPEFYLQLTSEFSRELQCSA